VQFRNLAKQGAIGMMLNRALQRARSLSGHQLVRSTWWIASGQVANRLLQAAYFLLLARLLGVTSYGIFAGAFALVNTVTPYSPLGSSMIFMRYVSLDRSLARLHWGNTIATIVAVSIVLSIALSLIGSALIGPSRIEMIVVLVVANCLMSQISSCASIVFLTLRRLRSAAANNFLSNSARFVVLAVMVLLLKRATAFQWSLGVLLSSTIAAVVTLIWVRRVIGPMRFDLRHARRHFWEGIGFSVAGSTESVYNDFDKILLSHYGMNQAAGIYTMAYRIVDFSTTPLTALVAATMPRLFAMSKEGFAAVAKLCGKLTRVAFAIGIGSACFTLVASPWVLRVAGHGFGDAVLAIRWLCWLPALRAIHQLAGSALTATGGQNYRTGAQATVGIVNAMLNFWLIPTHGWLGAAWASLASDGLLGVVNVGLVLGYSNMNRQRTAAAAAAVTGVNKIEIA
jgi:O-antigen/teichoic acid export membrane protein